MSRPSWVEVDLSAVAHNVAELQRYASGTRMCAVVKAGGYGHGAPQVAGAALEGGAEWLAVATVEEGVQLRDADIAAPVLLLSEPPFHDPDSDDLDTVVRERLTPTVCRFSTVAALASAADAQGTSDLAVHVKVDTGMHRLGTPAGTLADLVQTVRNSSPLRLGGIWSHLAAADTDPEFTRHQINVYGRALESVGEAPAGQKAPLRHLANTPGTLFHPRSHLDMIRTGLGIYGLYPHPAARELLKLRPAMRIISHVSHLQRHPAGTRPSYGRIRALASSSVVATLPVGYADGVPRSLSECGEVLIGGRRHPLAGRVTMDQMVVEVGEHPVSVGDQVVLVGSQGKEFISFDDWASLSDTINYEVVSRIGPRLPRRYIP